MRRILLFALGATVILAVSLPVALSFYLPDKAQAYLEKSLDELGFEDLHIENISSESNGITFQNIKLDKKGFSSIESITADYSWVGYFSGKFIKSLTVHGLNLVGEMDERGAVTLAGWDPQQVKAAKTLQYIKTINIESGNLDLLTESIGGVHLKYDAQIRNEGLGDVSFEGNATGTQRQFSAQTKIKGNITKFGRWHATVEIEQGKINLPLLKASRISGLSELSGRGLQRPEMMTQLAVGGMTLFELPWHGVSATISGTPRRFIILAEGKSVGQEGVEFTTSLEYGQNLEKLSGALHTQKPSDLFLFLQKNKLLSETAQYPALLDQLSGLSFQFEDITEDRKSPQKKLIYNIKDESESIDIKGNIDLNTSNKTASGNISMPPALLAAMTKNNINGFSAGSALLNGSFQTDFSTKRIKTEGSLEARLKDAAFNIGPLIFDRINGSIAFDDLASLSAIKEQSFSFGLPLKSAIEQKGTAKIAVIGGKTITISDPTLKLFGGTLASPLIKLRADKPLQKLMIRLSDIDLYKAGRHINIGGLSLTGSLKGALPLTLKDGEFHIEDGILNSAGPGIIRFTPKTMPTFLEGDDIDMETIRMALANYHYDFFEIRLDGPLSGDLKLVISARGSNPDLFERRPVALNLNMEAPIGPLFKNIMK